MSKNVEVPVEMLRESCRIGVEAAALCEKIAADQDAVDHKAPLVADTLTEYGLVDSLDKKAAIELLKDHGSALEIIAKLASQASKATELGSVAKSASNRDEYDPQNRPMPESYRVFEAKLNGSD